MGFRTRLDWAMMHRHPKPQLKWLRRTIPKSRTRYRGWEMKARCQMKLGARSPRAKMRGTSRLRTHTWRDKLRRTFSKLKVKPRRHGIHSSRETMHGTKSKHKKLGAKISKAKMRGTTEHRKLLKFQGQHMIKSKISRYTLGTTSSRVRTRGTSRRRNLALKRKSHRAKHGVTTARQSNHRQKIRATMTGSQIKFLLLMVAEFWVLTLMPMPGDSMKLRTNRRPESQWQSSLLLNCSRARAWMHHLWISRPVMNQLTRGTSGTPDGMVKKTFRQPRLHQQKRHRRSLHLVQGKTIGPMIGTRRVMHGVGTTLPPMTGTLVLVVQMVLLDWLYLSVRLQLRTSSR